MDGITLALPGRPGICVERSCEADAAEYVPAADGQRFRLCPIHAERLRALIDSGLQTQS